MARSTLRQAQGERGERTGAAPEVNPAFAWQSVARQQGTIRSPRVTPANAGVQSSACDASEKPWIPAFAGMTGCMITSQCN